MARLAKRGPRRITVLYPLPNTKDLCTGQNDKAKKRVAAYCRVSSGSEEQMGSLNAQTSYYEKYIKEKTDYIFAGIYVDEGISGTDLKKREAFNRMMQDARDGHLDMIITKSLSRFGRNTLDCLKSLRELKLLGVDVFFEKEGIYSLTSQGEMLLTLISAVAQTESLALSENVKWGIRRKYERGLVNSIPSGKFLGYDKDQDGNLVINETQAAIVRRIYQEFLDGYGTFQIARRLTSENVPMAHGGKQWCPSHIKKVLTNEKIKGDTRCQKTYNADYLTKRRVKNKGELPQHYFENTHPAIIDKVTWELVQLELERQKRYCQDHHISTYHRSNEKHPLSARIICSACGCTYMQLKSDKVGEKGRKYWRCSSFLRKRGTKIEGCMFTPITPDRGSMKPYNIKRRKQPVSREMLCTDIKIDEVLPEQAYIKAWNRLVDEKEGYMPEWQQTISGNDVLKAYRARELMGLVEGTGHIEMMPYVLMLKTLDHIEICPDGKLEVVFLDGTRFQLIEE
ncbi:recombinase family protein [Pelotomaculum propionicicum]|uniref:recombinase family protein n=1 Tax=Pelotomaculum propionicicum TaxID=258475 RepID=UPI003B79B817